LAAALVTAGCGGVLVRLANDSDWEAVDRRAQAMKKAPRGKAARAWATALVELERPEQARAVLLNDYRHGGRGRSLLALADLELGLGLRGVATAHYARLITLDLGVVQAAAGGPEVVCELLRERAHAQAALGEALAADADMRRVALICPAQISDDDRGFLSSLQPQAREQAKGQRSLPSALSPTPQAVAEVEAQLREELELARKRSPRAMTGLAAAARIQLEPDDVAVLLAAEFSGGLGPGFISSARLSAWIGDNEIADVSAAIDALPEGVREYALLRLASVRPSELVASERQAWIVAALQSVAGQGAHEAAQAWRVHASVGDQNAAEFALNTNLRDMIPIVEAPAEPAALGSKVHWSLRVPVDRRSFDLLLTLARLLELREQPALALELRRAVLVAGYEIGLAQVGPAAAGEVLRQLALGRPWQALAVAEIVPGPLVDEILPALASALALARAAGLDEALAGDRGVVHGVLGEPWFEAWDPRFDPASVGGLDLRDGPARASRCPELGQWLVPELAPTLARVGLDPEASRAALEAAFVDLAAPSTGAALARALEADLALACTATLINLLHAGPHALTLASLDERLIYAPELEASMQLQLHAELAAAHGADKRALLLTTSAAATSVDPRSIWARAATAGRSFGVREYTLEALRQVVLHSDGLDDPAARREIVLIRLRDVDGDAVLRDGDPKALDSVSGQLRGYLAEAPVQRRWSRLDDLLWALASEPRADAIAWARLFEVLEAALGAEVVARHPAAMAALERRAGAEAGAEPALIPELAYLSDAEAICEQVASAGESDGQRLLGAAIACAPRARASALAGLAELAGDPGRAAVRAQLLAGPIAVELEPSQPGVLRSVPGLAREELGLRVAFDLPLDPVWVTEP